VRRIAFGAAFFLAGAVATVATVTAQQPVDLSRLPELRDFQALRSSSNNPDPESNDDSKRPIPGETITLADLTGPGVVTHIWLTVAANEYGWPRLLRLRVYYDGSPTPSVDAPVGDFFAVGHGFERPVDSLVVRASSEGRSRNSYWPMPFRKSCRITVTNEGRRRVSNLYYHVDWKKVPSLAAGTAYFHARYRQSLPASGGAPYEVLSVRGRGHYVGTVFSVVQAEAGWFGEGDDFFFVDGEKKPSIEGTGTEDYFNDAWGLRVDTGPYAGASVAEGTGLGSRMTAYRWHLTDPIPFRTSLKFELEHKGWTFNPDGSVKSASGERTDLISSVAFWYQVGIAADQPEPPYGVARLPQGNATQIEVENALQEAKGQKGKVSVSKDLFWSKDVLFFQGEGPGARLDVPFDVAEEGEYEVTTQVAQSFDYGTYSILLDGKPVQSAELEHEPGADVLPTGSLDGYKDETYVGLDMLLGWPRLTKGRHVVTFVCTGKAEASRGYNLGVDNLILARVGRDAWAESLRRSQGADRLRRAPEADVRRTLSDADPLVREAAAARLAGNRTLAATAVSELTPALDDDDPVVRGLAALALREAGAAAGPALGALIQRLKDPDPNVRLMSANAIGTLGPKASKAVPALIEAVRVLDDHVHVLRSVASALGAIGSAAAPAIPALEELTKLPRARWAAEEAIRKIRD
jgi:D-arabinan exo alpha-(1,3)/(1,5)-arabinofuranosidase (non-reducing end)